MFREARPAAQGAEQVTGHSICIHVMAQKDLNPEQPYEGLSLHSECKKKNYKCRFYTWKELETKKQFLGTCNFLVLR